MIWETMEANPPTYAVWGLRVWRWSEVRPFRWMVCAGPMRPGGWWGYGPSVPRALIDAVCRHYRVWGRNG